MNYIVFDLEYNQPCYYKNNKLQHNKNLEFEIIEIGAVRLNDKFEQTDDFRMLIKPVVYRRMNKKVKRLTKITDEDLQYGFSFAQAIRHFYNWVNKSNNNVLCTWSLSDFPVLEGNLRYHNLNSLKKYDTSIKILDIQRYYMKYYNSIHKEKTNNDISLKNALIQLNIDTDKIQFHSALKDAKCTGLVLQNIDNSQINESIIDYNNYSSIAVAISECSSEIGTPWKIRCPKCGKFVKRLNRTLFKSKRFTSAGECKHCNVKIFHVTKVHKNNNGGYSYKIRNYIIPDEEYEIKKNSILAKEKRIKERYNEFNNKQ